ncbi:MAG: hypothetical protein RL148_1980 [Planctomycetota bacterium]
MAQKTLAILGGLLLTAAATVLFLPSSSGDESLGEWKPGEEVEVAVTEAGDAESAQTENPGAMGLDREAVAMENAGDASEPRTEVLLRGRVVNRTGGPVADAQVQLDFSRGGQRGGRPGGDRQRRIPEPVKTDAEGRFAFKGQMFRSLRVSLAVQHPDYAPARHDKDLGEALAEMDVGDLKVLAGGTIVGRVTDLAGTAVPGAELRLSGEGRDAQAFFAMMANGGRGGRSGNAEPQYKSDNNGFFKIPHLNAGGWSITARATKHTDTRTPTIVVEDEKEITIEDIRMGPGFVLTGVVSNAAAKPVAGAEVILRERRGGRDHRTSTNPKGEFSLDHLPGSELDLTVRAKDMLNHEQRGVDPSKTPGPLYITLQDGLRITGIAMDVPTSQPVTKFAVQAQRVRDLPRPVDPNDPRSQFESMFREMAGQMNTPEGRQQARERFQAEFERMRASGVDMGQMGDIRGMMGDFMRGQGGGTAEPTGRGARGGNNNEQAGGGRGNNNADQGGRRGRGGQGQSFQIELGSGNGGAVTMNLDGAAQGMEAFFNGGRGNLGKPEDHPEGKFELTGLQEGVYVVVLQSPDHTRFRSAEIELRQGAAPFVNVNLERGFTITGVVKDTDGNPVAGALVELRTVDTNNPTAGMNFGNFGQEAERMGRMFRRFAPQGSRVADARTNPEGNFAIEHAPPGLYRLSGSMEGYDVASTEPFQLAQDLADSALVLGKLGVLTGKVIGYVKTEKPVSVVAIPTGEQTMRLRENQPITQVQPDGTYRLENLAPGSYSVRASSGGMGELMREIGPQLMSGQLGADVVVRGGEMVEFDVALADLNKGVVSGIVTDNGSPARNMSVVVMPADTGGDNSQMFQRMARTYAGQTDAEGKYRIENVPEGNYELRVSASRGGGGGRGGFGGFGGTQLHKQPVYVAARVENTFNVAVSTCSVEGLVSMPVGEEPAQLNGSVSLLPGATEVPADFNAGGRGGRGGFGGFGGGGGSNALNGRIEDNKFRFEQVPTGAYLLVLNTRGRERVTQQVVLTGGANRVEVTAGKPSAPAQPAPGQQAAPQEGQQQPGKQAQPAGSGGGR